MTSPLRAFDHVQLAMPADGLERARAFWVDLLELVEVPRPEPLASRPGAWFEAGDVRVHVGVQADFAPAKKAHPAFLVDDVDALRAHLDAAGVTTRDGETLGGRRRFFADDPFGNRLEFTT